MQTLEQRRASYALDCIQSLRGTSHGRYVSYVAALPAAILANGLGQAMATELASAADAGHQHLYDHVSGWLCGNDPAVPYGRTAPKDLLREITRRDQDAYVRAQGEALAVVIWLKKFARAMLESESEA
ncbi:MAG: type III-B CRISPR module-associated protein Cmr5 [Vulcanimicrobiaceae bacterium]